MQKPASTVDLILLGMVIECPRSAYDIHKQVAFRQLQHWVRISIPSVYKKVLRLEAQGYLSGTQSGDKVVYSITPSGNAYFGQLMAQVATAPVAPMFDFNAVIANVGKIPREEALPLLEGLRESIISAKAFIEAMQPRREGIPLVGRAIMRQQVLVLEALETWMDEFLASFQKEGEKDHA